MTTGQSTNLKKLGKKDKAIWDEFEDAYKKFKEWYIARSGRQITTAMLDAICGTLLEAFPDSVQATMFGRRWLPMLLSG